MPTSTRNSALATIFSIRQPRRPRSSRIHLGIPVKDTPSYRDVGTQTDPEPDSSQICPFVFAVPWGYERTFDSRICVDGQRRVVDLTILKRYEVVQLAYISEETG